MYLAVFATAVSSMLIQEEEWGLQKPVYYTSSILTDVEKRYPKQEQLALALIMSSRKLRPYFQLHPISIITNFPLKWIRKFMKAYKVNNEYQAKEDNMVAYLRNAKELVGQFKQVKLQ